MTQLERPVDKPSPDGAPVTTPGADEEAGSAVAPAVAPAAAPAVAPPLRQRHPGESMPLREVLLVIRRDWSIIVAALVVALLGGWAVTALTPQTFETGTKVLLQPSVSADAGATVVQAAALVADQAATYAALVETPAVLDPALEASGVDIPSTEVVDAVVAELVPQTTIIDITVEAGSAEDAATLAAAVADSLITQVEERSGDDSVVRVTGSIVEQPEIPTDPASPLLLLNLAIALAVGLLVAFLVVLVRQALSVAPRTA